MRAPNRPSTGVLGWAADCFLNVARAYWFLAPFGRWPMHSSQVCLACAPNAVGYDIRGLRPGQQLEALIFR
jgi:hypothetical protein